MTIAKASVAPGRVSGRPETTYRVAPFLGRDCGCLTRDIPKATFKGAASEQNAIEAPGPPGHSPGS